jgi:elongation factor Ts
VKDLCLHIAAASPLYVSRDQVPEADLNSEREIAAAQVVGKPPAAIQKIVEGKLEKFYSSVVLLDQPFVKIPEKDRQRVDYGENRQDRREHPNPPLCPFSARFLSRFAGESHSSV